MIKLRKKKEYCFQYKDTSDEKEELVSVTFQFKFHEDRDYGKISDLAKKAMKELPSFDNLDEERKIQLVNETITTYVTSHVKGAEYGMIRECIVDCEGFEGEDGEPIKIKDEDGNIDVTNQKTIFEYVHSQPTFFGPVRDAYEGIRPKNLGTGLTLL